MVLKRKKNVIEKDANHTDDSRVKKISIRPFNIIYLITN